MSTLLYDVMVAYLTPLLTKHSSNRHLVYNDLMASYQSAQDALQQENAASTPAHALVEKRLEDLHRSQLRAYQEAAQTALKEHARECKISILENEQGDVDAIVKCIERPAWNVDESTWQEYFIAPLKERVQAELEKKGRNDAPENNNNNNHHQTVTTDDDDDDGAGDEEETETEDEEEEGKDADMEEENGQDEQVEPEETTTAVAKATTTETTPNVPVKQKAIKRKKRKVVKAKAVRKPGNAAKNTATTMASAGALGSARGNRGRGRARRGGRGGAKKAAPA